MELFRAIYISRVARKVRLADVEAIVDKAAERNGSNGITGLLVYTPSHFLQVLEGAQDVIEATLARIERDPRHYDLRIVEKRRVPSRHFERWAMVAHPFRGASEQELQHLDAEDAFRLLERAAVQP